MRGGGPPVSLPADRSDRHRRKEVGSMCRLAPRSVRCRPFRTDPKVSLRSQPRDPDLNAALPGTGPADPSCADRRTERPGEGVRAHRLWPLVASEHPTPRPLAPNHVSEPLADGGAVGFSPRTKAAQCRWCARCLRPLAAIVGTRSRPHFRTQGTQVRRRWRCGRHRFGGTGGGPRAGRGRATPEKKSQRRLR
jgi:hypothetical protein